MVLDYIISAWEWVKEYVADLFDFSEMELNWVAVGFSLAGSAMFWLMIWKIPTWNTFPFTYKMILSVALPIVAYPLVLKKLND